MSPNEITRSSLLDLLFENRNKQYGAYVLRKYYDNRLSLSIGIMLAAVLLALFLVNVFSGKAGDVFTPPEVTVVSLQLAPDKTKAPEPELPKPRQKAGGPVNSKAFTAPVIGPDPTNLPPTDDLRNAAISTHNTPGAVPGDVPPAPDPGPIAQGTVPPAPVPAPEVVEAPSAPPSFPGGMKAWTDFLVRNLVPSSDMQPGEKRSVVVRFWVDEEGHVGRFEVQQSGGAAFDNEVLRVLKRMPKWKPALQRGRPVATSFVQPVTFQAPEE
ncbi:energy transducer TonB [Flaviaesturariibacter aridisoli]|nr:TonB family protein [Flaviaesturariibacter aridisoli]